MGPGAGDSRDPREAPASAPRRPVRYPLRPRAAAGLPARVVYPAGPELFPVRFPASARSRLRFRVPGGIRLSPQT